MAAMRARHKIRAPRRIVAAAPTEDFDTLWNVLSSSLTEIHTKNASTLSFEELYRNAYRMVLMMRGDDLYERVKSLEENWLRNHVQKQVTESILPILVRAQNPQSLADVQDQSNERRAAGERFLAVVKEAWSDHLLCMGMITDVLMYMDRITAADRTKPSILVVSMALFRDHVLRAPVRSGSDVTVAQVFESTVLFMIQLERAGHIIDRPLIRNCMYMLEGLYETVAEEESSTLYLATFEPAFLSTSRDFYKEEGARLLEVGDAATFCRIASQRILEEHERCHYTLVAQTEPKIGDVLNEELIRKNIEEVVRLEGTGVRHMLDHNQLDGLRTVYTLNSRVDEKKTALTSQVSKRIVELGMEINASSIAAPQAPASAEKDAGSEKKEKGKEKEKAVNPQTASAIKWVDDILTLKKQFDNVWEKSFQSDQNLHKSIEDSFEDFINRNTRSSEYLSLFFDENLKKGIKGKTEDEVDALLDNGITLLRYIKDKDLFETYYKKHLARRLLMKRSASMDAERQMISKMKMEVGNQFTQRIEAMFKDMTVSEDLSASYKEHIRRSGDPDKKAIDLDVHVLTSTMWPMEAMVKARNGQVQLPCIFPREIDNLKQSFEKFYLDKHSGRKLSWQAGMGSADIRATFQRSNGKTLRYELNVSTYMLVILLLFNDVPDGESLTFEEIQERTCIPEYDLIRNLQSLAVAPKTRVLKKEPMSKDVKPTDRFSFNNDFQSAFVKVRIGVVAGGANKIENQDQRKETEKKMNDERGGSIEAAIVRIMKQRKKLGHVGLMNEVLTQLSARFVPDVNMVKKRIESLIDREYLERLEDEPATYGYIA
ncbi:putative SCF ubiquitin ligase subunit CulC [Penicillium brasilianum]|uniref:Putative SCF ubiquitin ligase subunit CulC n=1 Tax=Penicillium brasilianum TaxID=104259 RepID=A0A1S9RGK6_PENBI|nr:putative SCF ubiquitin ligase subunit CulC [Penicillium brasilianum]